MRPRLLGCLELDQLGLSLGLGLRVHGLADAPAFWVYARRYPRHPTSVRVAVDRAGMVRGLGGAF